MMLNEKLKLCRKNSGLSQEKIAELVGVSRQAVTKWENGQSSPNSENLVALASIYKTSLDGLVDNKNKGEVKDKKILHSNLTLIAIILQGAALNVCVQPILNGAQGLAYAFLLSIKFVPLFVCSMWMAFNLKYEKNIVQFRKNTKIELLYCIVQSVIALLIVYLKLGFLGAIIIGAFCLVYILIVNPKYMNRQLTKKKDK